MYEHDATEEAFKNGADFMKATILERLTQLKGDALGTERMVLSAVINIIRKMEVRV
jgi:hypothetical protein